MLFGGEEAFDSWRWKGLILRDTTRENRRVGVHEYSEKITITHNFFKLSGKHYIFHCSVHRFCKNIAFVYRQSPTTGRDLMEVVPPEKKVFIGADTLLPLSLQMNHSAGGTQRSGNGGEKEGCLRDYEALFAVGPTSDLIVHHTFILGE